MGESRDLYRDLELPKERFSEYRGEKGPYAEAEMHGEQMRTGLST